MAKGKKTGGRKKGSINKRTQLLEEKAREGITPLEYGLEVMRDTNLPPDLRLDAAKMVIPYLHARRAPEDKKGNTVPPVNYYTNLGEDE